MKDGGGDKHFVSGQVTPDAIDIGKPVDPPAAGLESHQ